MLIIGKTTTAPDYGNYYEMSKDKFTERLALVEDVENEWWKLWYPQCAASYLPYHSGREAMPKNSRDPLLPYRSKELVKQIVTIQCLVLLHRRGETEEIELEN
jgi:hypothetical protein